MLASAEITIDIPKMRAVAKLIESQMNIVKNCFDSIRKDALMLRDNDWGGASSDVYHESMKKLCQEQSLSVPVTTGYVVATLQGYVEKLTLAADEFVSTEKILNDSAEALPSNVFGV